MAELVVELTFPAAPITSLQKRIAKGIEQLYYTRLFLTSPDYADGVIWRRWHELGFHVAVFSPPPGTRTGDRVRVRLRAPSRTPRVSVTGDNVDALKDVESLLRTIDGIRPTVTGAGDADRAVALLDGDIGRVVVAPLRETLAGHGFGADEIEDFVAMLERGLVALTDDTISATSISLT